MINIKIVSKNNKFVILNAKSIFNYLSNSKFLNVNIFSRSLDTSRYQDSTVF